jgi:hypothetical protein
VTDAFADFNRFTLTTPYVAMFESLGIPAGHEWANQRQYVYFEVTYFQLLAMGYVGFLPGDKLVVQFTTASPRSPEILSFKVAVLSTLF